MTYIFKTYDSYLKELLIIYSRPLIRFFCPFVMVKTSEKCELEIIYANSVN